MLMESLLLASLATPLALAITHISVAKWAKATASRYLALDYELNASTLIYSLAASLLVAVLSTIAPIAGS